MRADGARTLYHCFPRPTADVERELSDLTGRATEILAYMLRRGLLLTPEKKEFGPNPVATLEPPPITEVLQKRACFTALRRAELFERIGARRHVDSFGPFAIGINARDGLAMGLLPVFYMPKGVTLPSGAHDAGAMHGFLGEELLNHLCAMRHFFCSVAQIEHHAHPANTLYADRAYLDLYKLLPPPNDHNVSKLKSMSRADALEAYRYLDTDRASAYVLAEAIEILLSLFQQVQSDGNTFMEYYDQREWRIVATQSAGLHCLDLNGAIRPHLPLKDQIAASLAEAELAPMLRKLNAPFKASDCALMAGAGDRRFMDFIEEVLTPEAAAPAIANVLEVFGVFSASPCPETSGYVMFQRTQA